MEEIYRRLAENGQSDHYPYHMPGHKRRALTEVLKRIGDIDITEIDGFDNLHHAEGILKQAQDRAARVFGAGESYYLVGGSTAGILSAVAATVSAGGKLLMARASHKSVYHSVYLGGLRNAYLDADVHPEMDFPLAVTPEQVREAMAQHPDAGAVLIVSPTYEGRCADVAAIAQVVHERGIPLIVDGAHGAHLGFHPAWPQSPVRCGADLVIQSLHKTLPAPTQAAILHVNGELVDRGRLRRYLQIYQTSSPSYVLMAGMEEAIAYMEKKGPEVMNYFWKQWETMLKKLQSCTCLRISPGLGEQGADIGKLTVSASDAGVNGQELYDILLEKYHLQPEMAGGTYVLFMFTVADTEEGYDRLTRALLEVDAGLKERSAGGAVGKPADLALDEAAGGESLENTRSLRQQVRPVKQLEIREAWDAPRELVPLEKCGGRIAGEFIHLYPPGIPVAAPGEILSKEILEKISGYIQERLPVQGIVNREGRQCIAVVKESIDGVDLTERRLF